MLAETIVSFKGFFEEIYKFEPNLEVYINNRIFGGSSKLSRIKNSIFS